MRVRIREFEECYAIWVYEPPGVCGLLFGHAREHKHAHTHADTWKHSRESTINNTIDTAETATTTTKNKIKTKSIGNISMFTNWTDVSTRRDWGTPGFERYTSMSSWRWLRLRCDVCFRSVYRWNCNDIIQGLVWYRRPHRSHSIRIVVVCAQRFELIKALKC